MPNTNSLVGDTEAGLSDWDAINALPPLPKSFITSRVPTSRRMIVLCLETYKRNLGQSGFASMTVEEIIKTNKVQEFYEFITDEIDRNEILPTTINRKNNNCGK